MWSHGKIWSFGFLFIWSFGHKFGPWVSIYSVLQIRYNGPACYKLDIKISYLHFRHLILVRLFLDLFVKRQVVNS